MGYTELISRLEALPRAKQAEVFEFVEFLSARCGTSTGKPLGHADWSDTEFSELSMSQAMRGMEQDTAIYTREDLQERW
ncbi:MAG: DUF2281 domain-containing protein [Gallionellaceae bacterium]|nr:MAG: DUF2281 domain-containing protein [Gallionellaceae bacterium]